MATRGRKPKPSSLKVLSGERPDRIPIASPTTDLVAIECPAYLDDEAKAEWGRICKILAARGTLSEAAAPALTLYCNAFSRWMRARTETKLVTSSTDLGSDKPNPAVAVEQAAEATMLKILESFGLTPASASRVPAKVEGPGDEFAELMKRRKAK